MVLTYVFSQVAVPEIISVKLIVNYFSLKQISLYDQLRLIFFLTHGSVHHDSMLNKRSNLMQQYADINLLQGHSTCFGCHSTHHQEH